MMSRVKVIAKKIIPADTRMFLRRVEARCNNIFNPYKWILYVEWLMFRLKYNNYCSRGLRAVNVEIVNHERMRQEDVIEKILSMHKGQSFLEIGIGSSPRIGRLKHVRLSDTKYTGCDFQSVCDKHRAILEKVGDIELCDIRFVANKVGTYSWNLFEMVKNNERFDVVYLDGHHTFYVDLPALVLGHYLLKPGGYYLVDDIQWTLDFMKGQLVNMFDEWLFYRRMYNFSDYTDIQKRIAHVDMMVKTILIDQHKYLKVEEYSSPYWCVLKKPV